ncbi:MAG: serine hydrolase domain-containing protein, partial [Myxococcales bacterium]
FRQDSPLLSRIAVTELDTAYRHIKIHGIVHDENACALGGVAGHAGLFSTADDLARFAQMMLNGGQLDGTRVLSRTTVALMTSDHLGKIKENGITPGELLLGVKGFTFGLGFAVRQEDGLAATPGRAGEFMWAGAAGTYFWVDPKEQLVGLLMTQAPGPSRPYYRKLYKQLVYQSIADELAPQLSASQP